MRISFLNHSRVDVTEIARNHGQGHSIHHGERTPNVSQHMKVDHDPASLLRLPHVPARVAVAPRLAIRLDEHHFVGLASCARVAEEPHAFVGQEHMTRS